MATRVLRLAGTASLVMCSLLLASTTRFTIQFADVATFLQMAAFICTLGMLACSVAAFWWPVASLSRLEWAAYVALALLVAEQYTVAPTGAPVHSVALIFGLLVFAIVVSRVTRRAGTRSTACNCGQ